MQEDYAFLDCRDRGHGWMTPAELASLPPDMLARSLLTHGKLAPLTGYSVGSRDVGRALYCWRCGTERNDLFTPAGSQLRDGRYYYVDGYLISGGPRGRAEYRKMAVKAAVQAIRGGRR